MPLPSAHAVTALGRSCPPAARPPLLVDGAHHARQHDGGGGAFDVEEGGGVQRGLDGDRVPAEIADARFQVPPAVRLGLTSKAGDSTAPSPDP